MYLIKQIYKLHCLLFYKLVKAILRLDKIFNQDVITFSMEWVMYRAFFAVFFIQLNWFFISLKVIEIIIKRTIPYLFEDDLISALLFIGVTSTFNFFTLIYKKRWLKYDEEFATYSPKKNRMINIAIPTFYILSVALYFLILEIWANLGHSGKIEGFFDI